MNVKAQMEKSLDVFVAAFAEPALYNGEAIEIIHEDGETNKKDPYQRGSADKEYFSLPIDKVKNPKANDWIFYCGEKYRVLRVVGRNAGFTKVETEAHTSIYPRGR